jgi:hypothetical protein
MGGLKSGKVQGRRTAAGATFAGRISRQLAVQTKTRAARGKERRHRPIDEDRSGDSEAAKERSPSME